MNTIPSRFAAAVLAALLALSACGGSDDDDDPVREIPPAPSAAQGLWTGLTDTGRAFRGLVLGDGTYYLLYSLRDEPQVVAGALQGNLRAGAARWTSPNAQDFNLEGDGVQAVAVEGSFTAGASFSGTLTSADGSASNFQAVYDPTYSLPPSLAAVAGTYTGATSLLLGSRPSSLTVAISGAVTGVMSGCSVSGAVQPRRDGNAYSLSVTLGASQCPLPGQTFVGIAYLDAATRKLYVMAPNVARSAGLLFVGIKPAS